MNNPLALLDPKYHHILSQAEPYILSYPENWKAFDLKPWGLVIPERNRLSCLSLKNEKFFELLHTLDDITFGPMGMPMEKWVFFDCAEMPGGITGMAIQSKSLPERVLKRFNITSSYDGPVPISMYMAIPMVGPGCWFGHNLSSANNILKPGLPGLGLLTKALALKIFQIKTLFGATQWDSKAMHIHLQLGNMQIMSALTPAHTLKKTLSYKSTFTDEQILQALSGKTRKAAHWGTLIPADDENFLNTTQKQIEDGHDFHLVGRPVKKDGKVFYPAKGSLFPVKKSNQEPILR